jgi:hypothetical protein
MKSSELYEFTNKELRDILKKNQVKNYSKMNKKDLIKKVNQLTNSQNGGGKNNYLSNIPQRMLESQRGQPGVSIANIAALEQQQAQNLYAQQQPMMPPRPGPALQQARNFYAQQQHMMPPRPGPALQRARILYAQQQPMMPPRPGIALQQARNLWQLHLQQQTVRTNNARQAGPALLQSQRNRPQARPRNALQNHITCPSPGWAQQQNDCWIDSAYYAMFVPSNLQDWFFTFLTNIGSSPIEDLKNFSELSREYLQGINGNQQFMEKKQDIKKNILRSIRATCELINPELYDALNAQSSNRSLFNTTGAMNRSGNGDASLFFKFISIIEPRLLYSDIPSWADLLERSNGNKVIQKYIRDELRKQIANQNIDIVAINASYYIPKSQSAMRPEIRMCINDDTVLGEILNIENFSLEAVIRGNQLHYTIDFKCSDNKWYNYDNMKVQSRITDIDVTNRNWQRQDGLIFIFRRRP